MWCTVLKSKNNRICSFLTQNLAYYTEEVCVSYLPLTQTCCVLMMTPAHLPFSSVHSDIPHSILFS